MCKDQGHFPRKCHGRGAEHGAKWLNLLMKWMGQRAPARLLWCLAAPVTAGFMFYVCPSYKQPQNLPGTAHEEQLGLLSGALKGALKEGMLSGWMLLPCAGCSRSISHSEGDISFFSTFIILVGKIHKIQTCLAFLCPH